MARWGGHRGVIFPFEEAFFRERGVNTTYVGHPFLGRVHGERDSDAIRTATGTGPDERLVGLFPGSRHSEVDRHVPVLVETARRLTADDPRVRVAIGRAPTIGSDHLRRIVPAEFAIVEPPAFDLMRAADVAITASGTATVEVAMADTPMLVLYRVSPLTWQIAKRLVRTPHVAMVNLIAEDRLVPEFLQGAATAPALAEAARTLLDDPDARDRIRTGYARIRERLSGGAGLDRAAELALGLLRTQHHV
jgi:lipid-A-disaccharide synthase